MNQTAAPEKTLLDRGGFLFIRLIVLTGACWALWVAFQFTPEATPENIECFFYSRYGVECPGCGITRGLTALAHGRFRDAIHFYPFVFPVFIGLIIGIVGAFLPDRTWRYLMTKKWVVWTLGLGAGLTGVGILLHWLLRFFRII